LDRVLLRRLTALVRIVRAFRARPGVVFLGVELHGSTTLLVVPLPMRGIRTLLLRALLLRAALRGRLLVGRFGHWLAPFEKTR
jgi:hypothetical protein